MSTVFICYIAAFVVYAVYAALPFLGIPATMHYAVGTVLSILAGLSWITISRSVVAEQIVLYGAYYDCVLTFTFLIIPMFFTGFGLSLYQALGMVMILSGIILTKF